MTDHDEAGGARLVDGAHDAARGAGEPRPRGLRTGDRRTGGVRTGRPPTGDLHTGDPEHDHPDDGGAPTARRWPRRAVVGGLAGAGAGAAALAVGRLRRDTGGPAPAGDGRPVFRQAATRPVDAGGFANRDESYANSSGGAKRVSATSEPGPTLLHPTAGEAAAATAVTVPTILDTSDPVIHLLRRTTFGPHPELVDEVRAAGIDSWLAAQLDPATIPDPLGDLAWHSFPLASADPPTIRASIERTTWGAMHELSMATYGRQLWSQRQLYEVMVDFWANHLNAPSPGPGSWDVGASYHAQVIRPHALGTFSDMLVAAGRHPAILRYLTADQSTKDAVNENLGREVLELHTVGVASGYTEQDVRNSAYILTGRTVVGEDGGDDEGTFRYDPDKHWVGPVAVLDFRHDNATAEGGLEVGDAYLRYLATHPATAETIARKLAVRFVADIAPQTLVDRLAAAYLDHETAIVPVLETLFRSSEFWAAVGQKVRRPAENIAASVRVLGAVPTGDVPHSVRALANAALRAGHRPLSWQGPNGYPDVHAAWRSAGTIVEIWNVHRMLVGDWQDGLTRPEAAALVAGMPADTVGDLVDGVCRRLCFQVFEPVHRQALVDFLGGDAAAPAGPLLGDHRAADAVTLVLDSPYFSLR